MNLQFIPKPFLIQYLFRQSHSQIPYFTFRNSFHSLLSIKTPNRITRNSHFSLFHSNPVHNHLSSDNYSSALKESVLNFLCTRNHESNEIVTIIDMTYGDGNHTNLILKNREKVKIICLDRDQKSFEKAKKVSENDSRVIPVFGKFSDLPKILNSMNFLFNSIDGIIIDAGISNSQSNSKRGFTPESNSILDMRLDPDGITAYQVLAAIDEVSLAKVLKIYGEEKIAKKIARAIIETRYTFKKVEKTHDLNELVTAVVGTNVRIDLHRNTREHVAQKVYNGLRRFVNNELNELNYAMIIAEKYLKPEGIVVTQCNSTVEDKIVKRHLTGNVIENCANDLSLKFVNHSLTVDSKDLSSLTYSPWTQLDKIITSDSDMKLRVAMKK